MWLSIKTVKWMTLLHTWYSIFSTFKIYHKSQNVKILQRLFFVQCCMFDFTTIPKFYSEENTIEILNTLCILLINIIILKRYFATIIMTRFLWAIYEQHRLEYVLSIGKVVILLCMYACMTRFDACQPYFYWSINL